VLGETPIANWDEIDGALQTAWDWWEAGSPGASPDLCAQAANRIRDRAEDLVAVLVAEAGKPVMFAAGEVQRLERTFRLAASLPSSSEAHECDLSYDPRGSEFAGEWRRYPVGPILGFVPYNWPLNLAAHKLAPAIAAGCPILLKLSPLAPLCTWLLGEILASSGWPRESLATLALSNEDAQRALTDRRTAMLSFTGSPKVGWMLKELAPRKRVALELGGNAPVIVEPDADLELAADRIALSGYGYAGQVCISAQNVFVSESVALKFEAILAERTAACRTGEPMDPATVCGPMISAGAAHRVRQVIDESGYEVIARAEAPDHPAMFAPTLLRAGDRSKSVFAAEAFGPILNLATYRNIDDLTAELNAGPFRLQASMFSENVDRAREIAGRLRYGGVIINEAPSLRFDSMPYGGEGDSGFGREGVAFAYEEMTTPRSTVYRKRS
jgi:acyl-CoA reductase-like NAD-dependent aldehyde dehydrogenase